MAVTAVDTERMGTMQRRTRVNSHPYRKAITMLLKTHVNSHCEKVMYLGTILQGVTDARGGRKGRTDTER